MVMSGQRNAPDTFEAVSRIHDGRSGNEERHEKGTPIGDGNETRTCGYARIALLAQKYKDSYNSIHLIVLHAKESYVHPDLTCALL